MHALHAWRIRPYCRPNQSHSSTYAQTQKVEVKLTAGVVLRMSDKEKREGQ